MNTDPNTRAFLVEPYSSRVDVVRLHLEDVHHRGGGILFVRIARAASTKGLVSHTCPYSCSTSDVLTVSTFRKPVGSRSSNGMRMRLGPGRGVWVCVCVHGMN